MARSIFRIYLVGALILVAPIQATAQADTVTVKGVSAMSVNQPKGGEIAVPDSTDYDSRALRFDHYRGTIRILRGQNGSVVSKAGWFQRLPLDSIVASSQQAVAEARRFTPNRTAGVWAVTLGFVAFAVDGIVVKAAGEPNAASLVTALGSSALLAYGLGRLNTASEALSKSLWWYNRDLKK